MNRWRPFSSGLEVDSAPLGARSRLRQISLASSVSEFFFLFFVCSMYFVGVALRPGVEADFLQVVQRHVRRRFNPRLCNLWCEGFAPQIANSLLAPHDVRLPPPSPLPARAAAAGGPPALGRSVGTKAPLLADVTRFLRFSQGGRSPAVSAFLRAEFQHRFLCLNFLMIFR